MTDETTNDDGTALGGPDRGAEVRRQIGDEAPSRAVVRAVASLTNTPVLDLEPLYEVVDPDHLDGVCASGAGNGITQCAISFEYGGCAVTVSDEAVRVRSIEEPIR